ncbi:conjugal transfer protein TraG N-terminal domain-containing protein [Pseudoalteromonas sp. Angola-18]|uniref:conjugal transfer protein TraG N-terminal domain-containing protein n=1 Tax=Pseudoalteromonas sp. Angola-18 TaxID=3025338 RepID=UPI00235A1715|nr:conjugal transfer protein TraG N-terminal domain-containing protein [Pseudoalteromonas sp. Angola-18]MDC9502941.1 conjugal transfer protein TraG N-terminal domain-containing protein [Pseudoalteromonas sp. Angola-18]
MDLNVYLQGDLEFANDTLVAVARMFNSGSTYEQIQTGAGILIFLTLFLSYFKYILDPERSPYPFKEFVFGVMGFVMFVGPLSPRFTVHLQSVSSNSLTVRTVSNVPFLVAVPSWAGTNLIGGLRDIAANNFITPSMGTNAPADPLGALVRLHSIPMSPVVNSLDKPGSYDFKTSIKNYINDCYIPDQKLSTGNANGNMGGLDAARIDKVIDKIKVTYPDYYTTIYLNDSPDGEYTSCNLAYNQIYDHLKNGKFPDMVASYYGARGVDPSSITAAYNLLTSNSLAAPNPYEVMAGRFLAFHTYEALQGQDSPWVNKMVFESMQKRLYEQAGERALFMNYMIPMISVFEMFTFFIGPVMILLSVMGGAGFAMIGKYMYLILFVNLWGFIKVFVDLFTYKAAEKAFSVSTGFANMDPFAMGAIPAVVAEVEGFLGVASALTAAIPMLAMFLLYGGVHSLMGVMSSINPTGKGSVDGTNMAPRLSSTWSEGTQSMGTHSNTYNSGTGANELNVKTSNSGRFADVSIDSGINNSLGTSAAIAERDVQTNTQAYEQTAATAMSHLEQNSDVVSGSTNKSWGDMNTAEKAVALKRSLDNKEGVTSEAASQAAFAIMGQLGASGSMGGGLPGVGKGGLSAGVSSTLSNMDLSRFGIQDSTGLSALEDVSKNHRNQTTSSEQTSYDVSKSNLTNDAFQESLNKGHKLQEQIAQSRELMSNLNEMYQSSNGLKFSQALNNEALAPLVDDNALSSYIDGLSDEQVNLLSGDEAGGSISEKKDYIKDKYQAEGAELAGPGQAGYGSMMAILDDTLAKQPKSISEVNNQADMLADWGQVVTQNAEGNNATNSQLNALQLMTDSYRQLDEATEEGSIVSNAKPDLLGLDIDTSNANAAEKKIITSNLNRDFVNDVPSESDYSKEKYGAMTEEQADAIKRVEGFSLFSGEQQEVIDRIQSGELNGAMWAFNATLGDDKFAKFAASRASDLGYDEKTVYDGVQLFNSKTPADVQDMFGRINSGNASFEDMKSMAQMSHAADYLTNTQSGNDSLIVGLGAGELDEFSGSTLAFQAVEQSLSETELGQDIDNVMDMGGKNGFSVPSAVDAVGLMAGQGGTVGSQFPYESSLVDLANTNKSYREGIEQADKGSLFGDGISYQNDNMYANPEISSFGEAVKDIVQENNGGYDTDLAVSDIGKLLSHEVQSNGYNSEYLSDIEKDKMLSGGNNNLLRSVYENSDEIRSAVNSLPNTGHLPLYKEKMNEMLDQAGEAYKEQGLTSLAPYTDNNKIDKTGNVDVPKEVSQSSSPVATFKSGSDRYTLQSQEENGSFIYQDEKKQSYSYEQGSRYLTPINSPETSKDGSANNAPTANVTTSPANSIVSSNDQGGNVPSTTQATEENASNALFSNSNVPLSTGVSAFAVGVPGLANLINSQGNKTATANATASPANTSASSYAQGNNASTASAENTNVSTQPVGESQGINTPTANATISPANTSASSNAQGNNAYTASAESTNVSSQPASESQGINTPKANATTSPANTIPSSNAQGNNASTAPAESTNVSRQPVGDSQGINTPRANATTSPANTSAFSNAQGNNAYTDSAESTNVSSQPVGESQGINTTTANSTISPANTSASSYAQGNNAYTDSAESTNVSSQPVGESQGINTTTANSTISPANTSASSNAQGNNAYTDSAESTNVSSLQVGESQVDYKPTESENVKTDSVNTPSIEQGDSLQPVNESQGNNTPTTTSPESVNTVEPTSASSSINQSNSKEKGGTNAPNLATGSIASANDVELSSTNIASNDEVKSTRNNDTHANDELTEELPIDAMQFLTDNEVGPQEFESESGEKYTRVGSLGSAEDPIGNVYVNSEGNAFYNDGFSSKLEDYGDLSSIDYVKQ